MKVYLKMEFLNADLPAPIFSVSHGEFKVIMKNGYHKGSLTMAQIVQPLVDSGKLKLTIPEKPKSSKQKFVKS